MSQGLILFENQIKDPYSQENARRLKIYLRDTPILKSNFQFFEINIGQAVTDFKYPHNLTFIPKDVIMTSVTNGVTVTWKYEEFDLTNIVLTTTGACIIRVFLGTYSETL